MKRQVQTDFYLSSGPHENGRGVCICSRCLLQIADESFRWARAGTASFLVSRMVVPHELRTGNTFA